MLGREAIKPCMGQTSYSLRATSFSPSLCHQTLKEGDAKVPHGR